MNISKTAVRYQRINISAINNNDRSVIVIARNIFDVISPIAITIIIGKLRNMIKLSITLIFKKNIRKYNFIVVFKFNIAKRDDFQTASNTHISSSIIKYLEYENRIFIMRPKKNNHANILLSIPTYSNQMKRIQNRYPFNIPISLKDENILLYSNIGKNL